ncbi:nesprin-2 [Lampris incognitus]|uniref:nesprin-2 n=1 Tax=Lampris incognitus TaxID=2546036 RepID=UPI0024B5F786|nr:nesprin-2 [Lampris incognitus]
MSLLPFKKTCNHRIFCTLVQMWLLQQSLVDKMKSSGENSNLEEHQWRPGDVIMPGKAPPPSNPRGEGFATPTGSDVACPAEGLELLSGLRDSLVSLCSSLPGEYITAEDDDEEEEEEEVKFLLDCSRSQDGDCRWLKRRWALWQEFMKEHAHLDAWLQLAEQTASSPDSAQIAYVTAKEELRKFENLRCEASSRLVQLDSLTQRNRTLCRLFQGTMRARLLALTQDCGRRWDSLTGRLETVTRRLKHFVTEREGFDVEREELALWLADLDVRLTELEHLTGNSCDKIRELQAFQASVCVISGHVSVLLERGEVLIQRGEPSDAQDIESHLLELMLNCSQVFNRIARLHTRLLSMRLVFEDDCILSQGPDSGCPSESLVEDEASTSSSRHSSPPATHEPLGLEWDPSVDIGGSMSHDEADSSYFSANTGVCYPDQPYCRDGRKRWSCISSFNSQSDLPHDVTNQEADSLPEGWPEPTHPNTFLLVVPQEGGSRLSRDRWTTSTPNAQPSSQPFSFDHGRVSAWLGVQSPALSQRRTSCSKAVQTDREGYSEGNCMDHPYQAASLLHDNCHDDMLLFLLSDVLLFLLSDPPCHRSNTLLPSFHLVLRYVNGPPPT